MIKHVVWDWNGTLVDDVNLCVDILNHVLVAYMKPRISVELYRRKFFFPVAKFYESIDLPSFGIEYEKLANDYIKEYRNRFSECMLHPRAPETLEVLNELSISQTILTAGEQKDVEAFACFFNVNQWVQSIDGASNIEAKGKGDRNIPFDRWDTNKDDHLSLDEYTKGLAGKPDLEDRFNRFDTNGDGKVSREEFVRKKP